MVVLPLRRLALPALAALLAGCAGLAGVGPAEIEALPQADVLMLGEQHDARDHQRIHRSVIESLGARDRLAAVVIEMAPAGSGTVGLPATATETEVRARLRWTEDGWPWAAYGPAVMAAVRAGVPVLGGDLPRDELRAAAQDTTLDARLDAAALADQQRQIRDGHCGLLPESQLPAMARVQIARDRSLAQTTAAAVAAASAMAGRNAEQTVVVLAGSGHADRRLGAPRHLDPALRVVSVRLLADDAPGATLTALVPGFDRVWHTPALPAKDYCAEMRKPTPTGRKP